MRPYIRLRGLRYRYVASTNKQKLFHFLFYNEGKKNAVPYSTALFGLINLEAVLGLSISLSNRIHVKIS
jgi:hypothetical protein